MIKVKVDINYNKIWADRVYEVIKIMLDNVEVPITIVMSNEEIKNLDPNLSPDSLRELVQNLFPDRSITIVDESSSRYAYRWRSDLSLSR